MEDESDMILFGEPKLNSVDKVIRSHDNLKLTVAYLLLVDVIEHLMSVLLKHVTDFRVFKLFFDLLV